MTPEDPQWPRASAWLTGGGSTDPAAPTLAVLGAPLSATSLSPSQAHTTPPAVRDALTRYSTAHAADDPAHDVDLEAVAVRDLGDLDLDGRPVDETYRVIADGTARVDADLIIVLGGDNAVTRPAVWGRCAPLSAAGLLTLDAHHDLRGFHAGISNGTPVRGLLEDGLPAAHVAQIGLGRFTNSRSHRALALTRGVTVVTAAAARREGVGSCVRRHLDRLAERCPRLWVDLDVDVLDTAFAPACPGARPGGLAPHELSDAAFEAGRHAAVVGIDIVEVDAMADHDGRTVDAAAQCLLHAAAGLAARVR